MSGTHGNYTLVRVTFRGIAPSGMAIFVDKPDGEGTLPIARSLIHGADDPKFDGLFAGEEIAFRLMAWKAKEAGLG